MNTQLIISKALKDIEMAAIHSEQATQLYNNARKALLGVSTSGSKKTKKGLTPEQEAELRANLHKRLFRQP